MSRVAVGSSAAVLVAILVTGAASAATAPAVRAAHDATRAARMVTFQLRGGGKGSVTLTRIGRTRTRIVLRVPASTSSRTARIFRGRDCNDQRHLADSLIALAPLNAAGAGAPVSRTIVSIPIERLTSDYVVDLRNSTQRSQISEACAHLGG